MAYWTAFFPADVVKSRLQTDAALSGKSFGDVFLHLFRTEGFKALYKVCVSRVHDKRTIRSRVLETWGSARMRECLNASVRT